jgi:hypothetical protein
MKIIYSRAQAVRVTEHVNTNNPHLTKPLSVREVCEGVAKAFVNKKDELKNGIIYTFVPVGDNLVCLITAELEYYTDHKEAYYFEIEVTEEMFQEQMENDIKNLQNEFGITDVRFVDDVEAFVEKITNDLEQDEDGGETEDPVLAHLAQQSEGKKH